MVQTKHLQSCTEVPLSKVLSPNADVGPCDDLSAPPGEHPAFAHVQQG